MKLDNYILDYARDNGYGTGNQKENDRLLRLAKKGDKAALNELILINQKAVHKIAEKYVKRQITNISMDDLVQEGNIALLLAVKMYKLNSGVGFLTYAMNAIERNIQNYLNNHGYTIRIPTKVLARINHPNFKESERQSNIYINSALNVNRLLSLDFPIGKESEGRMDTIQDLIPDTKNLEDECIKKLADEEMLALMKKVLSDKEYEVIVRRFGFFTPCETRVSIGKRMGVTREAIRLIEKKAIQKLSLTIQEKIQNKEFFI